MIKSEGNVDANPSKPLRFGKRVREVKGTVDRRRELRKSGNGIQTERATRLLVDGRGAEKKNEEFTRRSEMAQRDAEKPPGKRKTDDATPTFT